LSSYIFPLLALLILFIGVPWLILHYATRMKRTGGLTPDEAKMLEDLWSRARDLNRRTEALEEILKDDKTHDKGHTE